MTGGVVARDSLPKAAVGVGCPGRVIGRAEKGEQRRFFVVKALC